MENTLIYGMIALLVLIITLAIWIFILSKRIKNLNAGKNGKSLEKIIYENNELIKETRQTQKNNSKNIENLESEILKTVRNISVVRFDALGDAGGKQSFAIGLTDAYKNGVVISSMYTRGSMNVFAKEIIKGESKHKLTEEEKKVIK
jgi:biopolymer transport protein ExbB/TolQ